MTGVQEGGPRLYKDRDPVLALESFLVEAVAEAAGSSGERLAVVSRRSRAWPPILRSLGEHQGQLLVAAPVSVGEMADRNSVMLLSKRRLHQRLNDFVNFSASVGPGCGPAITVKRNVACKLSSEPIQRVIAMTSVYIHMPFDRRISNGI